jgi:hypothetical protein
MNETGADINFLRAFAQATGFKKIARKGREPLHRAAQEIPGRRLPALRLPHRQRATWAGSRGDDMKILREYCLKGGMLIADAGSARFHRSFTHFMRPGLR